MTRTFCAFEVYVTVDFDIPFEAVSPSAELSQMLMDMSSGSATLDSVVVSVENASTRNQADKELIDNFIIQGPGFDVMDRMTTLAVRSTLLVQAHEADTEGCLSLETIGRVLTDIGPKQAVLSASARGAHNQNMLHRLVGSSLWLQKLGEIFGGRTQDLLTVEDGCGKSPLMVLIDRDAPEGDIRSLLDAAEAPEALMVQPQGAGGLDTGWLPLIRACASGRFGACRGMLSRTASPQALLERANAAGKNEGFTALHMAATCGQAQTCELLLAAACDRQTVLLQKQVVQLATTSGWTALHFAARYGHKEVARTLLEFAPDPNLLLRATDSNAQTPADLAKAKGHEAFAHLLNGFGRPLEPERA